MANWIDPALFEEPDPFSKIMDAFATKLKKTEQPFGAKFLNEWAQQERRGGLKLFTFDGTVPVYFEPERDRTPAIIMYGDMAPEPEPRGEGNKMINFTLKFEGWIYTENQREGLSFYWRALSALFFPWLQPIDPVVNGTNVHKYWPSAMVGPRPWSNEEKRGKQPMVWEITVEIVMASANFPFMRGI